MRNNPKLVEFIRQQYPPGTKIRLIEMKDLYEPVPPGTLGEVEFIDDLGTIHTKFSNGRAMGLIPGEDRFSKMEPTQELIPMKLYMPLQCHLYSRNRHGDLEEYAEILEGSDAVRYADNILAAMVKHRMPEENERGLMHWYHKNDNVNDKVHSAVFTVEERAGALWGVADCKLKAELNKYEDAALRLFISGQASDGAGESLEQRDIDVGDREILNVHLWNSQPDWKLMSEAEFEQIYEQAQEPQMDDMSY